MSRILTALYLLCWSVGCAADPYQEDVVFESRETQLSGSIVFPAQTVEAAVVFVHGSGPQRRNLNLARRFAGQDIAALVYDKRGIGRSKGTYVQDDNISEENLQLLAADAVAAIERLSIHPKLNGLPLGLTGISQAGWIVPLAAAQSPKVAFMGLWSGPVCKVSEEDIYSAYMSDQDFFNPPTFHEVEQARTEPYVWPQRLGQDTDPMDSLRGLDIPGFWIFGTKDGSIPVDLSISRLQTLQESGKQFDHALFSGIGHDTIDATFLTMIGWIKQASQNERSAARVGTPAGEELNKYLGAYVSASPPITVTLTREGATLQAESKGERFRLTFYRANRFFSLDPGYGYYFFEFNPGQATLFIREHGNRYVLKRVEGQMQ